MSVLPTTTVLSGLVERLRAEGRFQDYATAFPERARVSESILPFVLAALHAELGRGLVALLPEDADARDAAEAAGWFLGEEAVALFPSRGVHFGSGLEPPPHLVGERARALEVLERGGLVCASAGAVAEGLPPARSPAGAASRRARRRARARGPGRAPVVFGLRTRRTRRGAGPVRRTRRARGRVRHDGSRAAAHRALRRRGRTGAGLLAVHAAGAPAGRRSRRLSGS